MSEYRLQNPTQGIIGPVKLQTVRDLAEAGVVQSNVLVSRDGGPFLPVNAFAEIVELLGESLAAGPAASYVGDLRSHSFFRVFHRFFEARATGLLVLRDGTHRKDVYLERGAPVFVASTSVKERLGEFLVRGGFMSGDDCKRALAELDRGPGPLGDILVRLGVLDKRRLTDALREQQLSRLVDLCSWEVGRYTFYEGTTYEGVRQDLGLNAPDLVMRAARSMPEKTILLRLGAHLHQLARRVTTRLGEECIHRFNNDERVVLAELDGVRTAVQIITGESAARRRTALTVLYLLWEVGGVSFASR